MAYIGKQPIVGNFQVCDAISVVNGQAAYTMQVNSTNVTPETAFHMLVSLNGVLQKPGSSFTISGSTITFASNLATGDVIDFIILLGDVLNIGTPSDGTVATASIADSAVTTAKLADDAVTAAKLASGAGGKVLQVVSGTHNAESSTSSSSFVASGLNAAITPSATSSKVAFFMSGIGQIAGGITVFDLYDGSNYASGGESRGLTAIEGNANAMRSVSFVGLLSPNTTSAITYTVHFKSSSGTSYFGRTDTFSNLILMEIGA